MVSTIVKENMDDLQEIYRFARERNIPMQHTISVVKSARGASNTAEESRLDMFNFPEEPNWEALEQMKNHNIDHPFARCASLGFSFWMTWNGHMQLCSFISKPFVTYSGDFQDAWSALNRRMRTIQIPKACMDCKWSCFCRRCPGNLCAESGDPEKVNDYLCNAAKRLYNLYLSKTAKEANRK